MPRKKKYDEEKEYDGIKHFQSDDKENDNWDGGIKYFQDDYDEDNDDWDSGIKHFQD